MSIILDLDDIHPENGFLTKNSIEEKVLNKLINVIPNIKITLFVTPDWIFKPQIPIHKLGMTLPKLFVRYWPRSTFRLDKFPEWCDWLSKSENFVLGIHGLHHFQDRLPYAAEFTNLSEDETLSRLCEAENIFDRVGLNYQKVFRPPGWGVNNALKKVLIHKKYILASHDMINADIRTSSISAIKNLLNQNKLVVLHGHINNHYGIVRNSNGLVASYQNLKKLLSELKREEFTTYEV